VSFAVTYQISLEAQFYTAAVVIVTTQWPTNNKNSICG